MIYIKGKPVFVEELVGIGELVIKVVVDVGRGFGLTVNTILIVHVWLH